MIPDLEQTFRWFGPGDPTALASILQTGATGIVSALHHIPTGEVWPKDEIAAYQAVIQKSELSWSVVESVNVHESIKTGKADRGLYIDNYIETLRNLSACGIKTVCYNFMPVLDWTRTHLDYRLMNGASALRFHAPAVAAFDLFILKRKNAFTEYTPAQQAAAGEYLASLNKSEVKLLTDTILAGLPGTDEVFTVEEFQEHLQKYDGIDSVALKANLSYFLKAVIPYAEEFGIKMCIHPDDPPFPILGLPRVVSTASDLHDIVNAYPSLNNGITLCTGSLGAREDNDLQSIITDLGSFIHFLHLRNVQREPDGSFYEAEHLCGSTAMHAVMKAIILEQKKRIDAGRDDIRIPLRPDHGHKILGDFSVDSYPGYSLTGRLKGLAELRGLEMGIKGSLAF